MDPFSQDVLSQSTGSRVTPEMLEMLGHQASQMFQHNGVPLNQAVRQLVAQHPELGNEHVKRVVEFANNVTFQEIFQNGEDKNVHFEVADPGVILRDLKDGGSPAHDGQTMRDYGNSPKQSDIQGEDQNYLDSQIWPQQTGVDSGAGGSVKAASAAETLDEIFDLQQQLEGTLNKLAESYELAGYELDDAKERLYGAIQQEVVQPGGAGLGGVMGALTKVASEDMIASILPGMVERLRDDGFQKSQLEASMEKRAGAVPNPAHPLITSFKDIIKIAGQMVVIDTAIADTDRQYKEAQAQMKKMAGPVTSAVRDAVNHPGKLPAAIRQRFPRT